ncbi:MAG: hypothetical protein OEX12_04225 [Gammaproteobacteria bacterium]|nr:hypothetical protein [Gammaproteobacteria bacterium]
MEIRMFSPQYRHKTIKLLLLVLILTACVPVPIVDSDVRYEKLKKGVYFLVVTGSAESGEEEVSKRWHQQALHLCGAEYTHTAKTYDRESDVRRNQPVNYIQIRGDIRCRSSQDG